MTCSETDPGRPAHRAWLTGLAVALGYGLLLALVFGGLFLLPFVFVTAA